MVTPQFDAATRRIAQQTQQVEGLLQTAEGEGAV